MDLRKIEYFLAAVEYGSFTQAAKNCNISQTAISQQIQSIENELGIQLFDRSEYRAKLTFAGKKFCRRCKHIINDYYNAVEEIKSLENGYSGNINIGISGIIEKSFLQKILQNYSQNNPNINIELKENNPNNLVENAKKNNLDIVFGNESKLKELEEFELYPIFDCEMYVITSKDHHWNNRFEVTGKDLESEPLIIFSKEFSSTYHEDTIKSFENDGFKPNITKLVDSFGELIFMVSINRGIAVLPKESLHKIESVNAFKLNKSNHKFEYCIARNKNNKNKHIDVFVQNVLDFFNNKGDTII